MSPEMPTTLITAGPTREAIDPVRFLSNRSSGKMGYALAAAAAEAGHEVILITGPVCLEVPVGVRAVPVVSAEEMYQAVEEEIGGADIAIMAAAVADYRPVVVAEEKIKKSGDRLALELERTRDILGSAREGFGFEGVLMGFAAETQDLRSNARGKLERKGCDLLAANDVSKAGIGFGSEDNEIVLLRAEGGELPLGRASKGELAKRLVAEAESLYRRGR